MPNPLTQPTMFAVSLLAMSVASGLAACTATPPEPATASTSSGTPTYPAVTSNPSEHAQTEQTSMQIDLTTGDKVLTGTLDDSPASRDFIALLPLTLTLSDYAGTEKISDLPARLPTIGSPAGVKPSTGDIAYYAPWGNLAIFYRDFSYSDGLIKLGHIDGDLSALTDGNGDTVVVIELNR